MTTLLDRVDAVIFDVDDTLVATSHAWQHALDLTCGQAAAQGACPDPAALAASYQAVSDTLWSDYPRVLAPLGSVFAIRRHVWDQALRACGAALPDSGLDQLVADFAAAQLAAIRPDPLLPGLLARLADRRQVAACSNGDSTQTRAKLARAGLLPLLGVITCGMDEQIRKPDPELLRRCCRALAFQRRLIGHLQRGDAAAYTRDPAHATRGTLHGQMAAAYELALCLGTWKPHQLASMRSELRDAARDHTEPPVPAAPTARNRR
jgi:FMN phosphatase YigB (HAD superfamily)